VGERDDDRDRDAILARRQKFVAAALAGLAATGTSACYESHTPGDADAGRRDAGRDTGPSVCLGAPFDAGVDSGPMPCLDVAIDDAGPSVCLSAPAPADAGEPAPCLEMGVPDDEDERHG
jgi:hypothetical protein